MARRETPAIDASVPRESPRFSPEEAETLSVDPSERSAGARVQERRQRFLEVVAQRRLAHDRDLVAGVDDPVVELGGAGRLPHDQHGRGEQPSQLEEARGLLGVEGVDVLEDLDEKERRVPPRGEVKARGAYALGVGHVVARALEVRADPLDPALAYPRHGPPILRRHLPLL